MLAVAAAVGSAVLLSAGFAQAAEAKCGFEKVCVYDGIFAGGNSKAFACQDLTGRLIEHSYSSIRLPDRLLWKTTSVINRCHFFVTLSNFATERTARVYSGEWAVLGDYRRFDGLTVNIKRGP